MTYLWRRAAVGLAIALVAGVFGAAGAPPPAAADEIYPLIFPVVGDNYYSDTWGAPRGGGTRSHEGTDIMADKMVPIAAAAAGTVGWMHDEQGGRCCAMALNHDDGWASWYIHMNNDTPGTDDGLGWGFADGIEPGVHVEAGQLIGWVGDSGNAEGTAPHLHFELHLPDGTPINPYPHLRAALVLGGVPEVGGSDLDEAVCELPDGCDAVALVDGARFVVHDEVAAGSAADSFVFGNPTDVPLMGDWDCDGVRTPAMYRAEDGFMYLRNSNSQGNADISFFYGDPSDVPLAGDFNGDGCDTLSIYRPSNGTFYVRNTLGTGIADFSYVFGDPGDKPFVGDFDGDGIDTIGLHRESTGFVYFRNTHTQGNAHFEFFYGDPGDQILAGDWNGDGVDTVAIYRPRDGQVYYRLSNTQGNADFVQVAGDYRAALVTRTTPRDEGAQPPEDPPPEDPPPEDPPAEDPPAEDPPPEDPPPEG